MEELLENIPDSDIDTIDMDISDVGVSTEPEQIGFEMSGYSKEDIAKAMDLWYDKFPNQQYTHEKYGYNWAQNYIDKVGIVTAESTTNLTPQYITEPWKIPDEKTREFVMNKLDEFHDIRISQDEKNAVNINNISGKEIIKVDELSKYDVDPNKKVLDQLTELSNNIVPGIPMQ